MCLCFPLAYVLTPYVRTRALTHTQTRRQIGGWGGVAIEMPAEGDSRRRVLDPLVQLLLSLFRTLRSEAVDLQTS